MIEGLNFQPWISEKFKKGEGKYGRLLILGESHYIWEDGNKENKDLDQGNHFTSDVVQDFLDGNYDLPFFRNLGLLFKPSDKFELWKEVAFANAIQRGLSGPDDQPTQEDIRTVKRAFWLLVENLEPDKILVCSKRMWNNWVPEDPNRSRFVKHIQANGKHSTIWQYQIPNKNCLAMGIKHPSKYFSPNGWRPIVMDFLSHSDVPQQESPPAPVINNSRITAAYHWLTRRRKPATVINSNPITAENTKPIGESNVPPKGSSPETLRRNRVYELLKLKDGHSPFNTIGCHVRYAWILYQRRIGTIGGRGGRWYQLNVSFNHNDSVDVFFRDLNQNYHPEQDFILEKLHAIKLEMPEIEFNKCDLKDGRHQYKITSSSLLGSDAEVVEFVRKFLNILNKIGLN
jgi:hypothetical protein